MHNQKSQNKVISRLIQEAIKFHQTGRLSEAEALYRQVLASDPNNFDGWHLLGVLASQTGNYQIAEELIAKALNINPHSAIAHNNLGLARQGSGRHNEAVDCFEGAIKLNKIYADAFCNMGASFKELERFEEGETACRRALELKPNLPPAWLNLGNLFISSERFKEAEKAFREAIRLSPGYVDAYYNLGIMLTTVGRYEEGIDIYNYALSLDPNHYLTLHNLGELFVKLNRVEDAKQLFKLTLSCKPDYFEAHVNLASIYYKTRQMDLCIAHYQAAHKIKPDDSNVRLAIVHQLQQICAFDEIIEIAEAICKSVESLAKEDKFLLPFFFMALPCATAKQQLHCAEVYAKELLRRSQNNYALENVPLKKENRIHIGYFSADLHNHVVSRQLVEIFENHDRECFKVTAYSYGMDDQTELRLRIENAFESFEDVHLLSDQEIAEKIHADGVDILVDITGYTTNSRSVILARRPAPIQVNYLGYPGSMGAEFIDYIIADAFIIPPEYEQFYSESVMRLPGSYMPRDCKPERMKAPSRSEAGLPEDGIVFCCFNQPFKISEEVLNTWLRLLKNVPKSVLWFRKFSQQAEENLRRRAEQHGVESSRLLFAEVVSGHDEHLARIPCADIFLDTTPYNAHATCSDALWMGIPVITCVGETFSSRVAGSLLTAMDMPELITYSLDEYYELALKLATNRQLLHEIHAKILLCRESSILFDSERFTRNLEALYEQMIVDVQHNRSRKLHIGGVTPKFGWEILNVMAGEYVDHVGNANDLSRFDDNTFEDLYASHILEHLDYKDEIANALNEWHRVVKPGGRIYISVPDLDVLADMFSNDHSLTIDEKFEVMRMMFGGHIDSADYHVSGLNEDFMKRYLVEAGFEAVVRVATHNIFSDTSCFKFKGRAISLNLQAIKR